MTDLEIVERIVKEIRRRGNQQSWIDQLMAELRAWASFTNGPDARAIEVWGDMWQPRPFLPVQEIAPFIPVLAYSTGLATRMRPPIGNARLRNYLLKAGLPRLRNRDGSNTFDYNGERQELFIVERVHIWQQVALTQGELDNALLYG